MREGAIGDFTVAENLVLTEHDTAKYARVGILKLGAIERHGEELVEAFSVKTPSLDVKGRTLSGGNIQKMILARELSSDPVVILAAQPTRGVDVGAAEYIHQRLIEARDRGTAVLVISEDLDEVMGLADRIIVIYEGRVVGMVSAADADRTQLGLMMAGASGR
jgi:simple sugar transport system ATP-binding protein